MSLLFTDELTPRSFLAAAPLRVHRIPVPIIVPNLPDQQPHM